MPSEILDTSQITGKGTKFETPPSPSSPRVSGWRVDDFEGLVYGQGYDAYIDKAMRCPCIDKATGSAQSTCKNCLGRGWFWIDRRLTRIVAQSMGNKRKNTDYGEINRGEAKITARAIDRLEYMDKVILIELVAYYTEILRPEFFQMEWLAYPVYEPLEVTNIYLFDTDILKLIPLTPQQYTVEGNKVIFSSELQELTKEKDVNVSIRYSYHPVYHVLDANRELMKVRELKCGYYNDELLREMPVNVIARKAHYLFDSQRFNAEQFDNTIYTAL